MRNEKELIEYLQDYISLCNEANRLWIITKKNINVNIKLDPTSFCHLVGFQNIPKYSEMSNIQIIELIKRREITFDIIFNDLEMMRKKIISNEKEKKEKQGKKFNSSNKSGLFKKIQYVKSKIKTLREINISPNNIPFDSIITDERITKSMHELVLPDFILFYKKEPYYYSFALNKISIEGKVFLENFCSINSSVSWKIDECCKKNLKNKCCIKKKKYDKFVNNISEVKKIKNKF